MAVTAEEVSFTFRPGLSALLASYTGAALVQSPALGGKRLTLFLLVTAAAGVMGWEAVQIWKSPRQPFNRYQKITLGMCLTGFAFVGGALVMAAPRPVMSKGWSVPAALVSLFFVGLIAEVGKNIGYRAIDSFFL